MRIVLTIVSLRWSLTLGILRKSFWQVVGAILGVIMGVGQVLVCWRITTPIGSWMSRASSGDLHFLAAVLVLILAVITLVTILFQLLLVGQGYFMNSDKFALYGIPDGTLQVGIFLAGLAGPVSVCALLCLLSLANLYRGAGLRVIVVAVCASILALIVLRSLLMIVQALINRLIGSRRAENRFNLIIILFTVLLCTLPVIGSSGFITMTGVNRQSLISLADKVAWTPLGAAFYLPQDALRGGLGQPCRASCN